MDLQMKQDSNAHISGWILLNIEIGIGIGIGIGNIKSSLRHSHKKRKDSLETRAESVVFSL